MLCVRAGTLDMLEFLDQQQLLPDVNTKLGLVPDITPPFWPWKVPQLSHFQSIDFNSLQHVESYASMLQHVVHL